MMTRMRTLPKLRKFLCVMSLVAAAGFLLSTGVFIGCNGREKNDSSSRSSVLSDSSSSGEQRQYRSVCIEKDQHGGTEYVLSRWLESKEKANEFGQYHGDFKYKGHRWRIDERVKPERAKRTE